jgi:intracellular sulfur oxidation DsrE/DsrF family protein
MSLTRKELLAAGAAALAPAACAKPSALVGAATGPAAFIFDRGAFERTLALPAKHRQCFAATAIQNGIVLSSMVASMYAYEFDLHEGPGSLHAVAVLYHPVAVALGLDDGVWNDLIIPAIPHLSAYLHGGLLDGKTPVRGRGNPYLHRLPNSALEDDPSIEALASRGCHFFLCNNALTGLAESLATKHGSTADEIHSRFLGSTTANTSVVPAGVMAINACQEAHFTYLQTAL